jgi:hypothetical protein
MVHLSPLDDSQAPAPTLMSQAVVVERVPAISDDELEIPAFLRLGNIEAPVAAPTFPALTAEEKNLLLSFAERFQDLVDLLCWASQATDHPQRNLKYRATREWLVRNYEGVQSFLVASGALESETDCDPIHALFAPEEVDLVIHSSTGLSSILTARTTVDFCLDHYGLCSSF